MTTRHPLQEGSFDPLALLQRSRIDGGDVRGIKLRMLWLRQREPAARVTTEMVTLDDRVVVMAAVVALPEGGEGAGHAASRIEDTSALAETIETTELRAIGRALDILGYVVIEQPGEQAAAPSPERAPSPPASEKAEQASAPQRDAARAQPPEHVQAIRSMREREQRTATAPAPESEAPAAGSDSPESPGPAAHLAGPAPAPERSQPRRVQQPSPRPADDDEPPLEDVSWTAFWGWARSTYQLGSRVQLEELLGQPVGNKPPGELRRLLTVHFDAVNPDES